MLKNIVIINDFAKADGGAGKVAIDVALSLSHSYNVYFFSCTPPIDQKLLKSKVKIICIGKPDILNDNNRLRAIVKGLWDSNVCSELIKLLKSLKPKETIVHVHTWTKALTSSVFKVTADLNFHLVLTLHDFFAFCPNGGFFNYNKMKICNNRSLSLKCLCSNCDSRNYYQKVWRVIRFIIQRKQLWRNNFLTLLYISRTSKNVSLPYIPKNVKIFPLPDPVDLPNNEKCEILNNEYYLYLGRLSPEKGAGLFCRALTELGLKGILVGDGYLKNDLEEKYPNLDFVGWASGDRKQKFLMSAKALIFPSFWMETYGLAVAEARSYGIPCIVPDRCAASEQIEDGKTGYIFKTGDLDSLKKAILKYERTDLKQMQANLVNSFHPDDLSMETHVKKLINIYNNILANGK